MFFGALNRNLLVTKIETRQFFCYKQITHLLPFLSIFESKVF